MTTRAEHSLSIDGASADSERSPDYLLWEPSGLGFLELFDDYVVTVVTTYEEFSRQARLLQQLLKV